MRNCNYFFVGLLFVVGLISFASADLLINEFDTNTSSAEYIELYNPGDAAVDLATGQYALVFVNGYNEEIYQSTDLSGTIPAEGYYVIAESGVTDIEGYTPDQNASWSSFQNGADGFALVKGESAANLASGDYATTLAASNGSQIDAVVYGGDDAELNTGFGTTAINIDVSSDGSASRIADGQGGAAPNYANSDWKIQERTPGATNTLPLGITNAMSVSPTEIEVVYTGELSAVDAADYSVLGTSGISFSAADIDAGDATLVRLTAGADIDADVVLDTLVDAANQDSVIFYTGITPIALTNTTNPDGIIDNVHKATYLGIISANDAYNNVWISDADGAYNGALIFDYSFHASVAVGDEVLITAVRDTYDNLTELTSPTLLETISTGNTPYGPTEISGADLDETIAADTDPGEKYEGQLVKISAATVESYDGTNYEYRCTDDDGTTYFNVGDNVDYEFGAVSMTVGETYDIVGVVDYDGKYRINPRDAEDIQVFTPPSNDLELTFEDDSDVANWGVYDGTSGYTTVDHNPSGGVDGTGAIEFGDGGYGFYIKRPLSGTVGTNFQLTVDVKNVGWDDPDTYPITIAVEGLVDAPVSENINALSDFTSIVLTGTITSTDGYVVIAGSNTTAANAGGEIKVWIDNLFYDDDYQVPIDNDLNLTFEDDSDVANWGVYDGTSGYTTVDHNPTGGVDGSGAIEFGDGGYGFYIKRPIGGTIGTDFQLSIDVKNVGWDNPDTYPITLAVEGLVDTPVSTNINALADFTTITLEGTITATSGYIVFEGSNTSAANAGGEIKVWIDNLIYDDAASIPDTDPPTLVSAEALDDTTVVVEFSEFVDPVTAAVLTNYSVDKEIGNPTDALVFENLVTLTLDTLASDTLYTLTVNNVEDTSANVIAANSEITFMWQAYVPGPDLFFSEYVEGSSSNKALELYNPTDETIELSNYIMSGTGNNAEDWEYYYVFPEGSTVAPGEVFVIVDDGADQALLDVADWIDDGFSIGFNGNDARGLMRLVGSDSILIDVIGDPNNPDAQYYSVAGIESGLSEHTLVRKPEITMGNVDWAASAGTDEESSEWAVLPQDFFDYLGSHPHYVLKGPEIAYAGIVLFDGVPKLYAMFNMPIDPVDAANFMIIDQTEMTSAAPTTVDSLDSVSVLLTGDLMEDHYIELAYDGITIPGGILTVTDTAYAGKVLIPFSDNHPEDAAKIITDFESNVGSFLDPNWSGSTVGTNADATTFAVSDEEAYRGSKSGKMTIVDDTSIDGGWYVRDLYGYPWTYSVSTTSTLMIMVKGTDAEVEMRLSIKDTGYEQGPWTRVSVTEDDWQVVSFDLQNDDAEGWVNGNGIVEGETVLIEGIHIRCPEDKDVVLYFDEFTQRPNSNSAPSAVTLVQPTEGYEITETDVVQDSLIEIKWTKAVDPDGDPVSYACFILDADQDTVVYDFTTADTSKLVDAPTYEDNGDYKIYVLARDPWGFFSSSDTISITVNMPEVGIDDELALPKSFALHQNYPNPFNPITNIKYDLPKEAHVKIMIYDIRGREVRTLVNAKQPAGYQTVQWNARDNNGRQVSSGYYIYLMQADKFHKSQKMILLK